MFAIRAIVSILIERVELTAIVIFVDATVVGKDKPKRPANQPKEFPSNVEYGFFRNIQST